MQDRKARPPTLEQFDNSGNASVSRPKPAIDRQKLAVADDESAGYDPYDKPPPLVTKLPPEAALRRRLRPNRDR